MDVSKDIKRHKNQAADARRSRDKWKAEVAELQAENRRLEEELAAARQAAAEESKNHR